MRLYTVRITKEDRFCGDWLDSSAETIDVESALEACHSVAREAISLLMGWKNNYPATSMVKPICDEFEEKQRAAKCDALGVLNALAQFIHKQQEWRARPNSDRGLAHYEFKRQPYDANAFEISFRIDYYPDGYDERRWHIETPLVSGRAPQRQ